MGFSMGKSGNLTERKVSSRMNPRPLFSPIMPSNPGLNWY